MTGDAVEAWQAVIDAAKIRPELVRYQAHAIDVSKTCATCGYHDGATCILLAGRTADDGTCDLFRSRPRHARS